MDLIKDLFKGDKVIWIIFLFLCLISIVEVFSAASTLTYKSGDHWGPITQPIGVGILRLSFRCYLQTELRLIAETSDSDYGHYVLNNNG